MKDMKDIVCNCQIVDSDTIIRAIHERNAVTIEDIRIYTGANTGCGRCLGHINEILDAEVPKVVPKKSFIKRIFKLK